MTAAMAGLAAGLVLAAVTGAGAQPGTGPKGTDPVATAAGMATARGVVKAVSAGRLVLEPPKGGGPDTLLLDDKTVVQRLGKPLTVKDLKSGDAVTVTYAMRDGKAVATRVWVRLPGRPGGGTGPSR
jgi:hypothetical protein